jgi:hypothetical protein
MYQLNLSTLPPIHSTPIHSNLNRIHVSTLPLTLPPIHSYPNIHRRLGVASSEHIEHLEMLRVLERVALSMPGLKPARCELLALGRFVDGRIETVAAV